MKDHYPHIKKKIYQMPVIEEVFLDREISLVMQSPEHPPIEPEGVSGQSSLPDYGTEYPMGGERPVY